MIKNQTILVLYGQKEWAPAFLVDPAGKREKLTCFERDNITEAYESCHVNWNNQLLIFGGNREQRQISRLTGHNLKRIGDLPFDFNKGACNVMANKNIFLCFHSWEAKLCRRSSGPLDQFTEVALSFHGHIETQTSSSASK